MKHIALYYVHSYESLFKMAYGFLIIQAIETISMGTLLSYEFHHN